VHVIDRQVMAGRVYVVAGDAPVIEGVARALLAADASVALVTARRSPVEAQAAFRGDVNDVELWERVAPHVEQRLGPVDGVAVDVTAVSVVRGVFDSDLRRRGHGRVVAVEPDDDVAAVISALAGTP
jgi:NAD(P)-dependent dehydrogenase (short-subunit alcohol dehydrogenase family)